MSRENIAVWHASNGGCNVGFDDDDPIDSVRRLEPSQAEPLANALTRVFYNEPQFEYMITDEQTRLRLLPDFFRSAIHASELHGEIYTTEGVDGGALWIAPESVLPLARIMRTEFPSMPLQWGWANLKRCVNLGAHLDDVHQQLMRGLHWRLLALGVKTSGQNMKVGGTLMTPVLSRADFEGLPCYLETFNEKSLAFFKGHGFRIAGSGKIPRGGPDFWAMIRTPINARGLPS